MSAGNPGRGTRLRPSRAALALAIERAIDCLDALDGDSDFEPDDEVAGIIALPGGPGDDADAEDTGDCEYDPAEEAQLDLADDEPNENAPVSGRYLGQADLVPLPAPTERDWQAVGAVALPEPPEGFVAARVLRG